MITENSCFESDCRRETTRIHLPVANICHANCYYCGFQINGNISSQAMPGHSRYIPMGRGQIQQYLDERLKLLPECSLIGVSGPGDILSSVTQLRDLVELVTKPPYNKIACCICTNGWDFFNAFPILEQWNTLKYITVTINSLQPQRCMKIYTNPSADQAFYEDKISAQMALLHWAKEREILLKINTVLSDDNADEILCMWNILRQQAPIHIFNLLQMQGRITPTERMDRLSSAYCKIMEQAETTGFNLKHNCNHCRADSYGRW